MLSFCVYLCVMTVLSTAIGTTIAIYDYKCMPYHKGSTKGVTVIDSCGKSEYYEDPLVSAKCSYANDLSDPLTSGPVTDIGRFNRTYQNINCFECHCAEPTRCKLERLVHWNIRVVCRTDPTSDMSIRYVEENLYYKKELNRWGLFSGGIFHPCDVSYEKPDRVGGNECLVETNGSQQQPTTESGGTSSDRKPFVSFNILFDVNCGIRTINRYEIVAASRPIVCDFTKAQYRWDPFFKMCRYYVVHSWIPNEL